MKTSKKLSQLMAAKFTAFQAAMRVLAGWRNCECELIGLEEAMALATNAMQRALPVFSALELGMTKRSELVPLAQTQIDLAYYAVVIVAMLVTKEMGMALEAPDKLCAGRYATEIMLDAFAPYLGEAERVWHHEILIGPSDDCDFADVHAN
jgi:hypothetical protein